MRLDGIYVAGHGTWLPPARSAAAAVADGELDPTAARLLDIESVRVSAGDSPPEMAARAARLAIDRSGHAPDEFGLLLHSGIYYQGHDLWAAASYIQRETIGGVCPAVEVRQVSNGGMVAMELGAWRLKGEPERSGVLLTAADRFCPPGFDRWRSDPGTPYGDGGAALVLSRRPGPFRLRSLVTVSDPELEGIHRGDDPFAAAAGALRRCIDLGTAKTAFAHRRGMRFAVDRAVAGQREAVRRALSEADTTLEEITWFILPHLGRKRMEATYFRTLKIEPENTSWLWGRTVGHLGSADQYAGLGNWLESAPPTGSRCLMMSVGAGFTWSCAVVEVSARTL